MTTISIHRISYLVLSALAEAKPVWARTVGIGGDRLLLTDPDRAAAAFKRIERLRADVQRSRGGDAVERSLLLGMIDEELAAAERRSDPGSWLETIATGYELVEDEPSKANELLGEIPGHLNVCIEGSGPIDGRVMARAEVRAADVIRWFRAAGLHDAALAVERSAGTWREHAANVPAMGSAAWERLFRAVHRLGFPAAELHALAVAAMEKPHAELDAGSPSVEELAVAVEAVRARWRAEEAPPIAVRPASPERPRWLSPYRPLRPLDPDRVAVLHPRDGPAASLARRYYFPGEHALRTGALRHRSDLRRVIAAPATIAGWCSFVAHLAGDSGHQASEAALAAADSGIHAGLWEPDEAAHRIVEASSIPMSRAQTIVEEALARPVHASAAFVGFHELSALWDSCDAPPERFLSAALACGPLPVPIAVQAIAAALRG